MQRKRKKGNPKDNPAKVIQVRTMTKRMTRTMVKTVTSSVIVRDVEEEDGEVAAGTASVTIMTGKFASGLCH